MKLLTLQEKIERHSFPEPMSGCLLWFGATDSRGYAQLRIGKRTRYVNHLVLEQAGYIRPSKRHGALHHCDVCLCVNLKHIYWGTQLDNVADAMRRNRHNGSGLSLGWGWNKGKKIPFQIAVCWSKERNCFRVAVKHRDGWRKYLGNHETREIGYRVARDFIASAPSQGAPP